MKDGFLWGVATSPFQHEGGYNGEGQPRNNWYDWEVSGRVERSGQAVDFWNRFEEDFDRAEMMGMTSYRLGIEWARLQPEGPRQELVPAVLDRYAEMVSSLRRRNLEPLITLQHFTTPRWLGLDPWLEEGTPEVFAEYVVKMLTCLNRRLEEKGAAPPRWFLTINEPNMLASSTYNLGAFPAGRRAWWAAALCALQTMLDAHVVVRRQVQALYAKHAAWGRPHLSFNTFASDLYWMDKMLFDLLEAARQTQGQESILGFLNDRSREFTRAYRSMDFPHHSVFAEAVGELVKQVQNALSHRFLREATFSKLVQRIRERPREGNLDFISFDYYDPFVGNAVRLPTLGEIRLGRFGLREWFTQGLATKWWDWHALPRGLRFFVERYAADYPELPIVIAENGMAERRCTKESQDCELRGDRQSRSYFIRQHVGEVQRLRKEGLPLAGYFHWSLTDNYEWGTYAPRFGIFGVDFASAELARNPRDEAGDIPWEAYAAAVSQQN
ncbi:MAG: glycoside hydrolase family 1 protein [Verrucomicrobia bacterium]|nr:glycoside hydrolase family 1 protein [Verrucomicrobiota bacterium]